MSCQGAATTWNLEGRAGHGPTMTGIPDDDLLHLSPEDRQRVRAWAEDRLINAIMPLRWHLQRMSALEKAASPALIAARHAVLRVMAAVEEARAAAGTDRTLEPYALRDRDSDLLDREMSPLGVPRTRPTRPQRGKGHQAHASASCLSSDVNSACSRSVPLLLGRGAGIPRPAWERGPRRPEPGKG